MIHCVWQHPSEGFYQFSPTPLLANASKSASTKPRAILHIGPHKTSSTYIQSKLCEAKDQLAREGFEIPIAMSCPAEQQKQCRTKHFAGVASQLQGNMVHAQRFGCSLDPLTDLNEALWSIYSANDSTGIILSSEEFDNLDDDGVAKLAKILSNYQTTVVIYFRREVEHIVSYYSEIRKAKNPFFPLHLSPISFGNVWPTWILRQDPMIQCAAPMVYVTNDCLIRTAGTLGHTIWRLFI